MKAPRRGFTLVELMAVLTVFSVVLGGSVMALQALLQSGARARASTDASIQLARFAIQLRADAHSALAVVVTPAQHADRSRAMLQLQLPSQRWVEYRLQPDGIQRLVRSGARQEHNEFYRLRPLIERGWQVDSVGASSVASVWLLLPLCGGRRDEHAPSPLRVAAAVGIGTQALNSSPSGVSP